MVSFTRQHYLAPPLALLLLLSACGGGGDSSSSTPATRTPTPTTISIAATATPTVAPTSSSATATPTAVPSSTATPTPVTSVATATPTAIITVAPAVTTTPIATVTPLPTGACNVSSYAQFSAAISAATPGSTIIVCPGATKYISLKISGKVATAAAPITIRSQNPLGTTVSSFVVENSEHIIVRDFNIKSSDGTLFKINNSKNIHVLRNVFDSKDVTNSQSSIVTAGASEDIEIAYNQLRDKNVSVFNGVMISGSFIKTQYDAPNITKRLWVHHNHFLNTVPYIVNGVPDGDSDRESISLGVAQTQTIDTNHLIEYNLFEDCDGEGEIITNKSSSNVIRYNTFKNSYGSLSVRVGKNIEVYGNYFIGEGASAVPTDPNYGTGGIRVYGSGHKIYNNYLQGLTGTGYGEPILIDNGDTKTNGTTGNNHERGTNIVVANNTVVNSVGGISIGRNYASYALPPENITVLNNLVVGSQGSTFHDQSGLTITSNVWSKNIVATGQTVSGAAKTSAQLWNTDPKLVGVQRNGYSTVGLSSTSPAINYGDASASYVTQDMDGQTRSGIDTGADEYTNTPVLRAPLKASDVGTFAPAPVAFSALRTKQP